MQDTQTPKEDKKSPWIKTQYSNLIRYEPSGVYFARFRVRGKLIWKSLKTDVVSVAKMRLGDLEKTARGSSEVSKDASKGKVTMQKALDLFKERIDGDVELKPKTKIYYEERISALKRSWPELAGMNARSVTKDDCLKWASKFSEKASPSAFNNTAAVLRSAIDIAVELGARYDNPATFIKRISPKAKKLQLPTTKEFEAWVSAMENLGDGWCRASADLVRFLAYGGLRITEAANVTGADCDFEKGSIRVTGDPVTGTKNSKSRNVPMIAEMRALLEKIRAQRSEGDWKTKSIAAVSECQGNMDRAAAKIGMTRITHHDLRHLFATRCIESGVDIPTVSKWLGHGDGGALAMKTYGHLRDDHSTEMAARVNFGGKV